MYAAEGGTLTGPFGSRAAASEERFDIKRAVAELRAAGRW